MVALLKRPSAAPIRQPDRARRQAGSSVSRCHSGCRGCSASSGGTSRHLLGATGTIASVGIYSVVNKVNLVGHVGLLSIVVAVKPTMAQLHDRGDRDGIWRGSTRRRPGGRLVLDLPFFIGMILYREPILRVFGSAFAAGSTALVILAVAELVERRHGHLRADDRHDGAHAAQAHELVDLDRAADRERHACSSRMGRRRGGDLRADRDRRREPPVVLEVWLLERPRPLRPHLRESRGGSGSRVRRSGSACGWLAPAGSALGRGDRAGHRGCSWVFAVLLWLFGMSADDRLVLRRAPAGSAGWRRRPSRRRARGAPRTP